MMPSPSRSPRVPLRPRRCIRPIRVTSRDEAVFLLQTAADIATFPGTDDEADDLTGRLLLRLQAEAAAGRTELIVVGHSDYLPPIAARLLGTVAAPFPGGEAFAAVACSVCDGNFAPASARLRWLVLPELLS